MCIHVCGDYPQNIVKWSVKGMCIAAIVIQINIGLNHKYDPEIHTLAMIFP